MISGDIVGTAEIWDIRTGEWKQESTGGNDGNYQFCFLSPLMGLLRFDFESGAVSPIVPDTGFVQDPVDDILKTGWGAMTAAFSLDSRKLVVGEAVDALYEGEPRVEVWSLESRALVCTLHGHSDSIDFVDFDPTGRTVATSNNFCVRLFDAETGALKRLMPGHNGLQGCLCTLKAIEDDGFPFVRNPACQVQGHVVWVDALAFIDAHTLASGSYDGTVKIWCVLTGAVLRTIDVGAPVTCMAVGRDWVQDCREQKRNLAFAMGHHSRLGEESLVQGFLSADAIRLVLERE